MCEDDKLHVLMLYAVSDVIGLDATNNDLFLTLVAGRNPKRRGKGPPFQMVESVPWEKGFMDCEEGPQFSSSTCAVTQLPSKSYHPANT